MIKLSNIKSFLILLVLITPVLANPGLIRKIIGGRITPWKDYPFMASLAIRIGTTQIRMCGGSIIHSRWILTAAHCLLDVGPKDVFAFVGSTYFGGGTRHQAKTLKIHEKYKGADNDIALIQLTSPISFGEGMKIKLNTEKIPIGTKATLVGWGINSLDEKANPNPENPLSSVQLTVTKCQPLSNTINIIKGLYSSENLIDAFLGDRFFFPRSNANDAEDRVGDIYENDICTATTQGQGACVGDSGGPLIVGRKQIGVVSRGTPCATGVPDVYTRVDAYVDWIQKSTGVKFSV